MDALVALLCTFAILSIAVVACLKMTEAIWFSRDKRSMLEQIEEARASAVYDEVPEVTKVLSF